MSSWWFSLAKTNLKIEGKDITYKVQAPRIESRLKKVESESDRKG